MPTKPKRLRSKQKRDRRNRRRESRLHSRSGQREDAVNLNYRELSFRLDSVDDDKRTVETTITTENRVRMFDWERWEHVDEVLLTSGMQRVSQVPLLDTHCRHSIVNQLGSVQKIRKEKDARETAGVLHFSSTAGDEWTKVREGHVSDVSAGYQNIEVVHIPRGEKQFVDGREWKGPVNVVTKWRLREVSLVPIGADEQAKLRGVDPAKLQQKEETKMDELLRQACEQVGMEKGLSDADAMRWFGENQVKVLPIYHSLVARAAGGDGASTGTTTPAATPTNDGPSGRTLQDERITDDDLTAIRSIRSLINPTPTPAPAAAGAADPATQPQAGMTAEELTRFLDEREQQNRQRQEAFRQEVDASLELAFGDEQSIPGGLREECLHAESTEDVRKLIKDRKAAMAAEYNVPVAHVGLAPEQPADRGRAAITDAMLVRCFDRASQTEVTANNGQRATLAERHLPTEKRAKGWEDFRQMPLTEIARNCLLVDGFRYEQLRSLNGPELAKAALGFPEKIPALVPAVRAGGFVAYHTTGTLGFITQDAVNKTLLAGYQEYPATWRGPFRQAESAQDFKTIHRIKLSNAPDLPLWPDNTDPQQVKLTDEEETYAVEARAEEIAFSWQSVINNDLDSISRTPAMMGDAAGRTVNRFAWSLVTNRNAKMSDGQPVFTAAQGGGPRFQGNIVANVGGVVDTTQLARGRALLRKQRGITPKDQEGNRKNAPDILNLDAFYLIVPTDLEQQTMVTVRSSADPEDNKSNAVYNTARTLTPIIEPILDDSSAVDYYLSASTNRIDTGEITFLVGQESPVTEDFIDPRKMSRSFIIVQTFGGAMIDHRGIILMQSAA